MSRLDYRYLYKTAHWIKRLRPAQLAREPMCRLCALKGIDRAASVADHIEPHRGDPAKFYDPDNLQSLCKQCHDSEKQSEEVRGFSTSAGEDGWPVDTRHPFNQSVNDK